MKNRLKFIDISRGIAIILIVYSHTISYSPLLRSSLKFIKGFHIALFFVLSGYTFSIRNKEFFEFTKQKFYRIILPYLFWAFTFLVPYFILGQQIGDILQKNSNYNFVSLIYNIMYGVGAGGALKQNTSLWFLPALFSMEVIYYFIIKITDKYPNCRFFFTIMIFILGYLFTNYLNYNLPFGFNTVIAFGIFFYIGYLTKDYDVFSTRGYIIKMLLLFIFGCICVTFNSQVGAVDYKYGNYFLFFGSGLFLSILTIMVSNYIENNYTLEYIGKNTMGILIFHKLIIILFQTKITFFSYYLKKGCFASQVITSLFVTTISIIISLYISKWIRYLFPTLIGEEKK